MRGFKTVKGENGMADMGNIIKQLRKKNGLTQSDFARILRVTPQAVSKWERSQGYPDITMLPRIAECFGVSMDILFGISNIV